LTTELLLPIEEIIGMYRKGDSIKKISKYFGVHHVTIKRRLERAKVRIRSNKEQAIISYRDPRLLQISFQKKIIEQYYKLKSYRKVADVLKISLYGVRCILKENNIAPIPYEYTHDERVRCKIRQIKKWKDKEYKDVQKQSHLGNVSPIKGKKLQEIYGKSKARKVRKKLRESHIGQVAWNKGKKGIFTKSQIEKMIATRRKNSGYFHTKEQKEKISKALKGKPKSPKHIEKVRKALVGKKYSREEYPNWGWRTSRKNQIFPKKDTKIEIKIQEFLTQLHLEYFTHKYISEITHSYQCDIFIPVQKGIPQKTIIECDGCFFHCCPICKLKKYSWTKERNELDKIRTQELIEQGFRVIRLWEHEIKKMELNDFKKEI